MSLILSEPGIKATLCPRTHATICFRVARAWPTRLPHRHLPHAVVKPATTHQAATAELTVRPAASHEELEVAARIRAAAYYETVIPEPRFVISLQRQMANDEYRSLKRRTAAIDGSYPECTCMVAVAADGTVLGTLDLRLPAATTGTVAAGVPNDDARGAFMYNVAVHAERRGQGIGKQLVQASCSLAATQLGALRLYTHVDCDNESAWALYARWNFEVHDDAECKLALPSGRLVLVADLSGCDYDR